MGDNAALAVERDEAFAQLHALAAQVNQMQTELTELRRQGANSDPPVRQRAVGPGADR